MFSIVIFFLTLVTFDTILYVNAGLFVINPQQGSTCHGGKPCTVDWLDNGQSPLLSAIGVTTVGLYTGKQRLVQTIVPVDVSKVHSLTFIPLPEAGPNSGTYYISFISTTLKQNNSLPYAAFSPFFRLDKMTGSFTEPNPAATSSIPVPSSIKQGINKPTDDGGDVLTTITVGTLSTSPSATTPASTSSSVTADISPAISPLSGTATATPSVTATPTSPSSISVSSATSSLASGFSTSVLPTSSGISSPVSSGTLTVPPASSSGLSPSPSSNASTNGAAGVGLPKGTGFSIAIFAVAGLALVL